MKLQIIILKIIAIFFTYNSYAVYYKLSDYHSGGRVVSLDIKGDYLYTAKYDGLIEIINISDPEQPQLAASIQVPDYVPGVARRVVVSDTLAFVLGQNQIHILDISLPTSPQYSGSMDIGWSSDIIIAGNIAYITGYQGYIMDISNIQSPQQVGTFYNFDAMTMHDTLIYGVNSGSPHSLYIINVANPLNPVLLNSDINLMIGSNADIGYRNGYVYIAQSHFWSIDVNDPSNPVVVDTLDIENTANKIHILNDKAIINNSVSGIKVIDISDPAHLSSLGYYDSPGGAEQVVVKDDIAYIGNGYSGLQIIDISDNTNPTLISTFQTHSQAKGIGISNNIVYLADGYAGLDVIDIYDIYDPIQSGTCFNGIGWSDNVSINNNNLCFSHRYPWPDLLFIDITNPANPALLHQVDLSAMVSIYGSIALFQTNSNVFVGAGDTLLIYDISDFSNPVLSAKYGASDQITDVVVEGNTGYISIGENGIEIIDLENINSPQMLSSYNTDGTAEQILLQSGILIIADGKGGFSIIDVSIPISPYLLDSFMPNYNSNILAKPVIVGNKLIIVDNEWNEIFTYDISDFNNIQLLSSLRLNSEIYKLIYNSGYFMCSINYYGMIILDNSPILSNNEIIMNKKVENEFDVYPNPFNKSTNINFTLQERSQVIIEIFNHEGKKIKSLINEYKDQGIYNINWDGTDNIGHNVQTGFYIIEIRNGMKNESKKVMMIK